MRGEQGAAWTAKGWRGEWTVVRLQSVIESRLFSRGPQEALEGVKPESDLISMAAMKWDSLNFTLPAS